MGVVHHLDRRAHKLAAEISCLNPDRLLNTFDTAELLGQSVVALQVWRGAGYGPPVIKTTRTAVRYRMGDLAAWLRSRACVGRPSHG